MQDNFEIPVLAFTLRYEGGKADDPRDPGGRTNRGVTQRTYASYRKAAGLSDADVFAMSDAELHAIYRIGFWDSVHGAALPAGVDLACFDFAVNSGPARACAALRHAGGLVGADKDPPAAVKAICAARLSFLHALGTFRTFGRGWTARVAACEALGVKMALHGRWGQPPGAAPTTGAALILTNEARAAAVEATRRGRSAKAAGAVAASLATAAPVLAVAGPVTATLGDAAACLGLALLAAIHAWRARQKATLSAAYAAAAG